MWRSRWEEEIIQRRREELVTRNFQQKMISVTFRLWLGWTRSQKSQRETLSNVLLNFRRRRFQFWRERTFHRCQQKLQQNLFLQRQQQRIIRQCWERWVWELTLHRMSQRAQKNRLVSFLHQWQRWANSQKERRELLVRFRERWALVTLRRGWEALRHHVTMSQGEVVFLKRKVDEQRTLGLWLRWRQRTSEQQNERKWKKVTLRRLWNLWRISAAFQQKSRERISNFENQKDQKIRQKVFDVWRQWTRQQLQLRQSKVFRHHVLVGKFWEVWRAAWERRKFLRHVWDHWQVFVTHQQLVRVGLTFQKRKVFSDWRRHWHTAVVNRHRWKEAQEVLESHWQKKLFGRWKSLTHLKRIRRENLLRQTIEEWRRVTQRQQRIRTSKEALTSVITRQLFDKWRRTTVISSNERVWQLKLAEVERR